MEMAIGKAAICVILNSTAWAQQFPVHHEHLRKFCAGTLTVDEHGIRFSGPKGHAWSWPYGEIQQLTLRAGSIHILSYKGSSNWKLGKDVAYTFTGIFPIELLERRATGSALRGRGIGGAGVRPVRPQVPGKATGADKGYAGHADLRGGCRGVRYARRPAHLALQRHPIHQQRKPLSTDCHDFGKAVSFSIEASDYGIHLQPALAGNRKKERENPMKKQIAVVFAAAAMAFAAGPQTFTGVITDDICANGDHKDMKAASDAKCVVDCVKGMNGKYVLYDAKAKKSYVLSDQKTPEKFAARKVTVVGTLDDAGKNLKVDSIAAAR